MCTDTLNTSFCRKKYGGKKVMISAVIGKLPSCCGNPISHDYFKT